MKNLLIALFLFLFPLLKGQFIEPKFGKIEISDLALTKYDKDTSASALMLFDNGFSEFTLNSDNEFQFTFERHLRIKFFKKSALNLADINIRLYENDKKKEKLNNLKAVTYNLVDGKIVKTKLDNDKIYEARSKNYVDTKFAFPEVKEGSVIELSYTIVSDFLYDFRGWTFQHSYPALWSQYKYIIPEYFIYRKSSKGYLQFDVNKNEQGNANYNIHYASESQPTSFANGGVSRTPSGNSSINARTIDCTLAIKDVPAFISETNIDCEDNYIESIEFELSSIQYPNDIRRDYTESWESVNRKMIEYDDFGEVLKTNSFIKDTVANICANNSAEIDKAIAIYKYLQSKMKWNGDYRLWASKGLKKPFNERTGNSAEINLLLTLMLQTATLNASPVIFSTRDNGIASAFYPTISKYNSVLAKVDIAGKTYLLDATSKYCPFGTLPANDINGKGRIVNNTDGDWVNLDAIQKYKETKSYQLSLTSEGKFIGTILENFDGYAAINYRNELSKEKSNDDYIRKIQEGQNGLIINNFKISNRYENDRPISDSLSVEITDHAEIIGDKIIFNPLLIEKITKNRYTLENRMYPVDYNYPYSELYAFEYSIPEGYQVESMPQSISFKLPDNSVSINYIIQNTDNKIKVLYRRNINKIQYLPDEYKALKEMYDQIVKKHSEQVILKKIV